MKTTINIFLAIVIIFLLGVKVVGATEKVTTLVNPVRGRELWRDKSLKPIRGQYRVIRENDFGATWLLQDEVTDDSELVAEIKSFNKKQELGVFLEVTKKLALKARVYFDEERPSYDPGVIFLSGYERKERVKIIDKIMDDFKTTFGYFPKSAGAWWIDSYSLNYLERKYGIRAALIVADQKTTDNYGVWGQWWGFPYFPDKTNILTPGNSKILVMQWAQRDPETAYFGQGPEVSNHSLQANDYISLGLDTEYFKKIASIYFDQRNKLGQITVGLETGMESVPFQKEYEKQLAWIKKEKITDLTMSQMADKYRQTYGKNPNEIWIENWRLTPNFRENKTLNERIDYVKGMAFEDYQKKNTQSFLRRIYDKNNLVKVPIVPTDWWWQIGLIVTGMLVAIKLPKLKWVGVAGVLGIAVWAVIHARYTVVNGEKMIGFLVDNLRFVGINLKHGWVNTDLSNLVAKSMLKIRVEQISYVYWLSLGLVVGKIYGKFNQTRKDK